MADEIVLMFAVTDVVALRVTGPVAAAREILTPDGAPTLNVDNDALLDTVIRLFNVASAGIETELNSGLDEMLIALFELVRFATLTLDRKGLLVIVSPAKLANAPKSMLVHPKPVIWILAPEDTKELMLQEDPLDAVPFPVNTIGPIKLVKDDKLTEFNALDVIVQPTPTVLILVTDGREKDVSECAMKAMAVPLAE